MSSFEEHHEASDAQQEALPVMKLLMFLRNLTLSDVLARNLEFAQFGKLATQCFTLDK